MNYNDISKNGNKTEAFFSKLLLEMIKLETSNFVFSKLGKTMSLPKRQGTTKYTVRRYNHLPYDSATKHNLTDGVVPTALKAEAHTVTGVIKQKGAYIKFTDQVDMINFDSIKDVYLPELSRHAGEVVERDIIESLTDASEYFVGVGHTTINDITATDVLTFKDLRINKQVMSVYNRKGHKNFKGQFGAIVHNNVMQDLLDDPILVNKLLVPGQENKPMKEGSLVGYEVLGMYILPTLLAEIKKNATNIDVYTSYVVGNDPYMVLKLEDGSVKYYSTGDKATQSDPLNQVKTIGYKLWTGAKIIDPLAITKVYSASAYTAPTLTDTIGGPASQA